MIAQECPQIAKKITRLDQLKGCQSRKDLARLLGYKPNSLTYVLYETGDAANYKHFSIAKRRGGKREIDAPNDQLKFLQRRLARLLQDCLQDTLALEGHKAPLHHGFQRNRSIITNARPHRNRRHVFNLDLENFFPTIHIGRLIGFFEKNRNFQLTKEVATTVAQICCYNGKLPQGAPTSPVVSNLICQSLDYRLSRLANEYGCTYTRYADDLTFSTSQMRFPRQIANKSLFSKAWRVGRRLRKEIKSFGFVVNVSKVRMQYAQSRQSVTGLIVNQKVNVPKEFSRTSRSMVDHLTRTGKFFVKKYEYKKGKIKEKEEEGTFAQLIGRYSYIRNVKTDVYSKSNPQPEDLMEYETDYRKLLLYTMFFNPDRPLIVTEGKTDPVYLKAALRGLHAKFPDLIEKNGKNFKYKVDFFKFTPTNRRILGIDGGTSHLLNFLSYYRANSSHFHKCSVRKSVIVVLDNDSGAKPFLSWKDSSGNQLDRIHSPFHMFENVYIIFTPIPTGATESKIEDFFARKVINTKISGKKFNPNNTGVSKTEYGKQWFATKVIWPNKTTIRYSLFEPFISLIRDVAVKSQP